MAAETGAEAAAAAAFERGTAAFKRREYEEAEREFSLALEGAARDATVWSNRAAARLRLGKPREALADARECVRLRPDWAKAYFRVGAALHALDEPAKAYKAACMAAALEPRTQLYTDMRASLREALAEQGDIDQLDEEVARLLPKGVLAGEQDGDDAGRRKVPVTVLSGFLGAGKTTLMNHLLHNKAGLRVAVIVNDMSEINVDAGLIASEQVSIRRGSDEMVELSNGCICCTLRDDLLNEIVRIATEDERIDYILVESTGISEPIPVAQTFLFEDVLGRSLSRIARLDTLVTVVDASAFATNVGSLDSLKSRSWEASETDARTVADLLVDQIEFANVIILNKEDRLSAEALREVRGAVGALNPGAHVVSASFCKVAPEVVLNTGRFDMRAASQAPGWLAELRGTHTPETEEYGIRSFVFAPEAPFRAEPLAALLANRDLLFEQCKVIRSKGLCWLAEDPRLVIEWATAGQQVRVQASGFWNQAVEAECASATCHEHGHEHAADKHRHEHAADKGGDRKTQLVFIGVGLDTDLLQQRLEACLAPAGAVEGDAGASVSDLYAAGWAGAPEGVRAVVGCLGAALEREGALQADVVPRAAASRAVASARSEPSSTQSEPSSAPAEGGTADAEGGVERLESVRNAIIAIHESDGELDKEQLTKLSQLTDEYAELMAASGLVDEDEMREIRSNAQALQQVLETAQ